MSKFYVTFGQRYRHEPHPSGIPVDPDATIEIEAETIEEARTKTWAIFGEHHHQVMDQAQWNRDKKWFPHGAVTLVLVDGHDPGQVEQPTYLGDSVYVQQDSRGVGIVLTTRNGMPTDPSNTIYLEWGVYEALRRYVTAQEQKAAEKADELQSDDLII